MMKGPFIVEGWHVFEHLTFLGDVLCFNPSEQFVVCPMCATGCGHLLEVGTTAAVTHSLLLQYCLHKAPHCREAL